MGRIAARFGQLKKEDRKALVAYITAGDPDLKTTLQILAGLEAAGVDVLEIGVPFSDPTADGPVIQAASRRALQSGTTLTGILEMIAALRKVSEIPVVLFGYYNPIYVYGPKRFASDARRSGVDGILVVDLPPEEAAELRQYTDRAGIDFIPLIAPTSPEARIRRIVKKSRGFIYYISITGVTGTAAPVGEEIIRNAAKIQEITDLPLVVGFGITTAGQARAIAACTDGIVIGSAFVRLIGEHGNGPQLVEILSSFTRQVRGALDGNPTGSSLS
jgi:tryptophan synthase alpha chain